MRAPSLVKSIAISTIVLSSISIAILVTRPATIPPSASDTFRYYIEKNAPDLVSLISQFAQSRQLTPRAVADPADADIIISSTTRDSTSQPIRFTRTGTPAHLSTDQTTIVEPKTTPTAYLTITKPDRALAGTKLADLETALIASLKGNAATDTTTEANSNTWDLTAIGDIIIGRAVYKKMLQYDPLHPFARFSDQLSRADLTLANLENAFSDPRAVITDGGMTFVSPTRGAAGLKTSGIDAVNLANNHSYNGGAAGFLDTIATLDQLGINHFGGGTNAASSREPLILTVKGTRVALLGYSSIVGSTPATNTAPGMNYLSMAPWGTLNENQLKNMDDDIQAAKAKADLVFIYYHWSAEYTHDASSDQRTVAHRAIDAGADLILGTHPHWVQGIEWYKDHLITYSLGNFIFDQEWSAETKQGALLHATFDGKKLVSASFDPYTIHDYNQPAPATANARTKILNDIFTHSWWP